MARGQQFQTVDGQPLLSIDLRQVGPNKFQLTAPFKYLDPTRANQAHVVPAHNLMDPKDNSDLASVPFVLWWFIASYGHQTAPALLHDHLLKPDPPSSERREFDRIFREALRDAGVRLFRRWIMWAGVSVQTIRTISVVAFVLLVVQLVAGWAALWGFTWGDAFGVPWWAWVFLPAVIAVLWTWYFRAVLIGTYVGAFLLPATIFVVLTVGAASVARTLQWLVGGASLSDGEGPIVAPYRVPGWDD